MERDEDEAQATERIVSMKTGETVGFLYVWEDGVAQPFWMGDERSDVVFVKFSICKSEQGYGS